MKRFLSLAAVGGCISIILTSCETRPSLDSSYQGSHGSYVWPSAPMAYHGELTEWDVLGTGSTNALGTKYEPVLLRKGERVLVIQSGAFSPDDQMVRELQTHCTVAMFSGIQPKEKDPALAERLRATALNGGCGKLLVYWGVLQTAQWDQPTKNVSWLPVIGQFVPDRNQLMRIQLKAFVVDAASGRWNMFIADSFEDERLSAPVERESSDQAQVARLKALAYHNLVDKLF